MAEGLEIIEVTGRRMLDSEGLPAVEAEGELENGARHGSALRGQRRHGPGHGGTVGMRTV